MFERDFSLRKIVLGGVAAAGLIATAPTIVDAVKNPTPDISPDLTISDDGKGTKLTGLYFSGDLTGRQIEKGINKAKEICAQKNGADASNDATIYPVPGRKDVLVIIDCK